MTLKTSEISAIILAGGIGTRMGSKNKGLLIFNGKPLIEHVLEKLHNQVSNIVISCNKDLDQYRRFNYPIAIDDFNTNSETDNKLHNKEGIGPLAGLLSAGKRLDVSKFPLLWRLPYIGEKLFMHRSEVIVKTDLIVQITPRIIHDNYSGIDKNEFHQSAEDNLEE